MSVTPPSSTQSPTANSVPSSSSSLPSPAALSSASVDYKWYLPTSTPSYVVQSFVKHSQPRSLRGRQKEYITAFAKYYFSKKPSLSPSDLSLLLFGDGERRGLIEACGALKGIGGQELRGSAVLSLELLLMLIDCNVNTQHGEEVLDVIVKGSENGQLNTKLLSSMRLDKHLSTQSSREYALKLIFILSESCPPLQGKEWIGSQEAQRHYAEWEKGQLQEREEAEEAAKAEDDDRELTSWSQVKLDDLDAEDMQVDAALAELIAEVDAEGEKEAGQKDPLGILTRSLPSSSSGKDKADVQASSRIGKAAAQKMKILWKSMKEMKGGAASTSPSPASTTSSSASPSVSSPSAASLDLMHEVMLKGSTSTDREDFNPILFLSTLHSSSSLQQLQKGLTHLQRSVNNRAAAMKSLIAEHFGQYVFCLDTIDHLQQLMQGEVVDKTSRAVRIGSALADLNRQCEEAYGSVIATKRGSDRMRETLLVLRQYKFLFSLPGEIAEYAEHKQYAQVVRSYKKARSIIIQHPTTTQHNAVNEAEPLLSPGKSRKDRVKGEGTPNASPQLSPTAASSSASASSSPAKDLPSLVLHEVFLRVSAVRATLFRQLESPFIPLDDQVRAIQFLLELDCDVDPAWYFLQHQRTNIGQRMEAAVRNSIERRQRKVGHEEGGHRKGAASLGASSPPASPSHGNFLLPSNGVFHANGTSLPSSPLLVAPWNPFGNLLAANPALASLPSHHSPSTSSAPSSPTASAWLPASSAASSSFNDTHSASALHHLIHKLCSLIQQAIPDFLRLAHLIATRQLTTSSAAESAAPSRQSSANVVSLQGVSSEHRQAIQSLLAGLFHQFSAYVRLALFPLTNEVLQLWEQSSQQHSPTVDVSAAAPAPVSPSSHSVNSPRSPFLLSASAAASVVDKASEHAPFSLDDPPSPSCSLPLIPPPSSSSSLPLPPSMFQNVHMLLKSCGSMQELGLSAESLQELTALRTAIIRWYSGRVINNAKAAIEGLKAEEDWSIVNAKEGRGRRTRRQPSSSTPLSVSSSPALRRTSLPSRFQALLHAALQSLTAIPSIKTNYIIKLIAGPSMDCMKAFAHALLGLTQEISAEEEERDNAGVQSRSIKPPLPIRLLLVLSNLRYTRSAILPALQQQLVALFPASTHPVLTDAFQRSVLPVYDELDAQLIQLFLRHHLLALHMQIRSEAYNEQALLFHLHARGQQTAGVKGETGLGTRGVIIDVCQQLVHIHADLFHLCPALIPQCMEALFAGLVQSILWCSQHIVEVEDGEEEAVEASSQNFWRQYLPLAQLALLEIEFIERTLETFANKESDDALDSLTELLEGKKSGKGGREEKGEESEDNLARIRSQQLVRDITATSLMFHCFSNVRSEEKKEETKERKEEVKGERGRGQRVDDEDEKEVDGDEDDLTEDDDEDGNDVIEEDDEE